MAVWLIRHCTTEWSKLGIKFGRLDPPLDIEGLNAAAALAARFDNVPVNEVVTSPLLRARQTAEVIAGRTGAPLRIAGDLIEADHGPAEGLHELARRILYPDMSGIREPDESIRARAVRVLDNVSPNSVVVTHKGVLRALGAVGPIGFGTVFRATLPRTSSAGRIPAADIGRVNGRQWDRESADRPACG